MIFLFRPTVPGCGLLPGLAALSLCAIGSGEDPDAKLLTRDEAVRLAYRENREIGIATLEIERARVRARWSGRLENPELEVSASGDGFGNDEDEGVFEVAFAQKFPVTSRLREERHLHRHQVVLAEAEIAEKRRQLAGEVDLALVGLIIARDRIAVARELVDLNRKMLDFLETQAKEGLVSSLDVVQARLEARTLQQQVEALGAEEKQAQLALNQLLGVAPGTSIRVEHSCAIPDAPPVPEISLDEVLARRPDYVLSLARTDEAEADIALEEAKRWQDVSVRLFVEQEDAVDEPDGLDGNTFAGFGISVPLPLRDRNQEGIAQARIDREAAGRNVEATRFRIRAECEEAFQQKADAWKLAREASGEILELAEDNESEFRKAYQQGQASLVQVQRAQEQVLELKRASLEFLADYHRAAARARLASGAYPGLSAAPAKNPR